MCDSFFFSINSLQSVVVKTDLSLPSFVRVCVILRLFIVGVLE